MIESILNKVANEQFTAAIGKIVKVAEEECVNLGLSSNQTKLLLDVSAGNGSLPDSVKEAIIAKIVRNIEATAKPVRKPKPKPE